MLSSTIVGRVLPNAMPCGGTITVLSVAVEGGWYGCLPVICCELLWSGTGNEDLDDSVTIGSLAPGTALWAALADAGPVER